MYEIDAHKESPKLSPRTGAHFNFDDMCARIRGLMRTLQKLDVHFMSKRHLSQHKS